MGTLELSNSALLSFKILLSAGRNISSKKWRCNLFFNKDFISPIIFHSQPRVEHTLGERRTIMQKNNLTFHEANVFFFKCPPLHISKKSSLLDLLTKQKTIRQEKLRTT